jgi:hypothetical protein
MVSSFFQMPSGIAPKGLTFSVFEPLAHFERVLFEHILAGACALCSFPQTASLVVGAGAASAHADGSRGERKIQRKCVQQT